MWSKYLANDDEVKISIIILKETVLNNACINML